MKQGQFTSREDEIIVECIKRSTGNLSKAFELASTRLRSRSKASVSTRYYSTLKHGTALMAIGNEHGLLINTKNMPRNISSEISSAKLKDDLLKMTFDALSKEKIIELVISDMSSEDKSNLLLKIVENI